MKVFKVSVIIPNYNHAQFLNKRIDSVLNQTYQNYEIIILDDCSTDNSREVIEKYRNHDKVVEVCYNNFNCGSTFKQWLKGISLSKGELIWIAESDDYAEPDFLQVAVEGFRKTSAVSLSYTSSNVVDEFGKCTDIMKRSDIEEGGIYVNNGREEVRRKLTYGTLIPNASAVVFKKSSLSCVNESFATLKMCGDWQFWIDVVYMGDIVYTNKPLNNFRRVSYSVNKPGLKPNLVSTQLALESLQVLYYTVGIKKIEISLTEKLLLTRYHQTLMIHAFFRKQIVLGLSDMLLAFRYIFGVSNLAFVFWPSILVKTFVLLFLKYYRKLGA